jgi:hypothetical protein
MIYTININSFINPLIKENYFNELKINNLDSYIRNLK